MADHRAMLTPFGRLLLVQRMREMNCSRSWAGFLAVADTPLLGPEAQIRRGGGLEFVHVAVDDCSRVAFAQIRAAEDGPQAS